MLYTRMIRPVLYRMGRGDPEVAHSRTLEWLTKVADTPWLVNALTKMNAVADPVRVFGIDFPNTVGLAAGMDKNGVAIDAWPALGFGFVEIGTVTWQSQPGNPRPRLYRLPESRALINRMGFNNDGASALAKRLGTRARPAVPIGISIGKSKVTPIEQAVDDYVASFGTLYGYGDYFAINVSSPNTPGLRNLQDGEQLTDILTALQEENARQARGGPEKPILVKIAPDLTENAIAQAIEVCLEHQVAGIIATNTTLARDGVADSDHGRAAQSGGLSGGPLRDVTRSIVSFIHRETNGELPIIGVGGITSGDHAGALIDAGASLVQLYTGLVYDGPSLVRKAAKSARKQAETAHSSYSRGPSRSSRVGSADSAPRAHHQPPVPGYSNSPVNPYPTSGPANPYPTSGAASGHSVSGPGYLHSGPTSGPGYGDNPYPASGGGYRHQEPRSGSVSGGGYQGAAPVSGSSSPYSPGYGDNPYPASGGGYQGAAHVSGAANPYGPGYPDTTGARQDEPPTGSANPYPQDRRYSTQPHSDDIDPRTGRPYRDWGTN